MAGTLPRPIPRQLWSLPADFHARSQAAYAALMLSTERPQVASPASPVPCCTSVTVADATPADPAPRHQSSSLGGCEEPPPAPAPRHQNSSLGGCEEPPPAPAPAAEEGGPSRQSSPLGAGEEESPPANALLAEPAGCCAVALSASEERVVIVTEDARSKRGALRREAPGCLRELSGHGDIEKYTVDALRKLAKTEGLDLGKAPSRGRVVQELAARFAGSARP